ncbi:MAG TPA: HAD family hydrolase [Ignavibacteriaceae bacterium]|nr:HAD family hydrolase [Ignavibacteriaceae bacterium]
MHKYKGIIFDIDGTLTSTNELIFASFNYVAEKYLNRTFSYKQLISFFGPTEDVILRQWCGENYEKARKDYYDFYTEHHHLADLYPGIKEIIKDLKTKKIFLSVYTGKGKNAAAITLKKLGIYNYFDLIITGDDVKEHKPSPEGIHIFLEKYKLKKEEVLMIGDAIADIKAARKAGIKIASVTWDSNAKEEIMKLGSDYVFNTVEELKEHLLNN